MLFLFPLAQKLLNLGNRTAVVCTAHLKDTVSPNLHSVKGLDGEDGISFESVSQPGKYISVKDKILCLSDGSDAVNSTFYISKAEK